MRYDERLVVPPSWHVLAVGFSAIAGSFPAAYTNGPLATGSVYVAVFILVEALLWFVGRATLRVAGGVLVIDGAEVPLTAVTGAVVLADVRSALVPGTPALTRPWLRGGLRVTTAGGPGWVLSTRRPTELAAALGTPVAGAVTTLATSPGVVAPPGAVTQPDAVAGPGAVTGPGPREVTGPGPREVGS